jgi:hypothetical protein
MVMLGALQPLELRMRSSRTRTRPGITRLLVASLLFSALPLSATSRPLLEQPAWTQTFDRAGVQGTLLVYDEEDDRWLAHDAARAQHGYIPAST